MKFYEDPLYIRMCREAKEIQEGWKPEFGDFISLGGGTKNICVIAHEALVVDVEHKRNYKEFKVDGSFGGHWPCFTCPPQSKRDEEFLRFLVWLPRQDQLQEIWRQEYLSHPTENGWFGEFVNWMGNKYGGRDENPDELFDTMEQLWLAFIMWMLFSKLWDFEEERWKGGSR